MKKIFICVAALALASAVGAAEAEVWKEIPLDSCRKVQGVSENMMGVCLEGGTLYAIGGGILYAFDWVNMEIVDSPLEIWKHLAVKLAFNCLSTGGCRKFLPLVSKDIAQVTVEYRLLGKGASGATFLSHTTHPSFTNVKVVNAVAK